jgi:hypothetical protein
VRAESGLGKKRATEIALEKARVRKHIGDRTAANLVYVEDKLINFVA